MTKHRQAHSSRIVEAVDRWSRNPHSLPETPRDRSVAHSWQRCLTDHELDPSQQGIEVVLENSALRQRRERMEGLYHIAHAEMESLYHQISGSGYEVILTDSDGYIVNRVGNPDMDEAFARAGLWPGADWSEQHAGTNGIGTCIAEHRPVVIHRDEHFLSCNAALSCSAAPIHAPDGGLSAVLDVSSVNCRDTRASQTHTAALVGMSARVIENAIFLRTFRDRWILRFHIRPEFVGLPNEGILACDGDGRILAVNAAGVAQLGLGSAARIVHQPLDAILDVDIATLHNPALRHSNAVWPVREIGSGNRYFAMLRPPELPAESRAANARRGGTIRPQASRPADAFTLGALSDHGDAQMDYNARCAERVVDRNVPILIHGETGTGKEAMAQAIHNASARRDNPFVAVNCASIPESLIESELFGYCQGAFTGARREGMRGKVLQSSGGTLFLDEIGDMPRELQTRLLRVLEEQEVLPLGSETPIPVALNVISATHRDLNGLVAAGVFREDLLYRLAGITLELPALRDRADKETLIRALLAGEQRSVDEEVGIDPDAFERLLNYHWPGNIRQLRNCLRTALALSDDGIVRLTDLPREIMHERIRPSPAAVPTHTAGPVAAAEGGAAAGDDSRKQVGPLEAAERDTLLRELERFRWNVTRTANSLGLSRNTLYRKLRKYGIYGSQ